MNSEQLQAARAVHWRQNQSPLLTLEDAMGWFQQHPLCLYLPRPGQLPAPAPSFVEACLGSREATPGAEALEHAQGLLVRLTASHTVVPLNLFGSVGEQPDFLAHSDALPFVLSLRADSDWKRPPQKSAGHAVSPLVLELWKVIEKEGSLSAGAARQALGRELTEAAVLRGLGALWQTLRISPVYTQAGEPAVWEMLRVHHRPALETAAGTGQVTALSLLVSMYLQSVYAASSEEIEIFLSPLASRARVREAVRGLAATRQIHSLSMDAQTYYFLEGGLPEFPEAAMAAAAGAEPVSAPRPPWRHPARPLAPPASPRQEPIFRRAQPQFPSERHVASERPAAGLPATAPSRPMSRPPSKSTSRPPAKPASRPASRPDFRPAAGARPSGTRDGASGRTPWKSSPRPARPDGRGAAQGKREGGPPATFPAKRTFPPRDARGPQGPARPSRPSYPRPGAPAQRSAGPRPGAGAGPGQTPEKRGARPGKWVGDEKRTGDKKRAGAWTGAPRREGPRPWSPPAGQTSATDGRRPPSGRRDAPFRPRTPGKFSRPAGTTQERPQGRPAERPPRPFPGRGSRPAGAYAGKTARPGGRVENRGPQSRPGRPSGAPPAGKGTPGERPRSGRPSFSPRPRPRQTGGQTGERTGGRGPRPPFVPGGAPRKPGKPSPKFRGPQPDRRKPGA